MSTSTHIMADKIVDQHDLQQMGLKPAWIAKHSMAMGCLGRAPRRWLLSRVKTYIQNLADEAQQKAGRRKMERADNARHIDALFAEVTQKNKNKGSTTPVSDFDAYCARQGGVAKKQSSRQGRSR